MKRSEETKARVLVHLRDLAYLSRNEAGAATSADVAQVAVMNTAVVRDCMAQLVADGCVEVVGVREGSPGPGRRPQLYRPSDGRRGHD